MQATRLLSSQEMKISCDSRSQYPSLKNESYRYYILIILYQVTNILEVANSMV